MIKDFETVSPLVIKEGILDICGYLCLELKYFLEKENRYYGTLKSYVKDMTISFSRMNQKVSEEDMEIYGKILWVLRPQIYFDFKRLGKKRLSHSDRVMVLMKRLLDYSGDDLTDFRFQKELGTVHKLVNRMYDNIKNPGKDNKLYSLKELVENSVYSGKIGKVVCNKLDLITQAFPKEKENTLVNSEQAFVEKQHSGKIMEISF